MKFIKSRGIGITVLNQEELGFFVEGLSWMLGLGVAPHDHQMWGIVEGIDGIETNIKWYVLVQKG